MPDRRSFDRFAADYDRFASLEPATLRNWLIGQLPTGGIRALDAGCGSGRYTQLLAGHYHDVTALDISEPLIDIARRRGSTGNVRYVLSDLMDFTDGAGFDLVFSSTTLHHVQDPEAALLHLRDMVRPGGSAILIDNVASRPTPARWVHVVGALRNAPGDVLRVGAQPTAWLLKFRMSKPWLDHLASDRYLSRAEFERRYGAFFPGARFANLGYAHGLVWEKKNPATVSRG